jgi:predicted O-linked N-acetylglucosamine transferase (SPINDLY family)
VYSQPPSDLCPEDSAFFAARFVKIVDFAPTVSCKDIARRIKSDGVHILANLNGHTHGNIYGLSALRPALVQIAMVGLPGLMQDEHTNFSVTDCETISDEQINLSMERLVFLSNYQPNPSFLESDCFGEVPPSRENFSLPENVFIIAYFGELGRLSPAFCRMLCSVLRRVARSVLWLRVHPLESGGRVLEWFRVQGFDKSRIIPAYDLNRRDHARRSMLADVVVSPAAPFCPMPTHTCTYDALAAGSVCVASDGIHWHQRVAASLIFKTTGSRETIAPYEDLKGYEEICVRLGVDKEFFFTNKQRVVEARIHRRGIFDQPTMTKQLQLAFIEMLRQKTEGNAFKDIFTSKDQFRCRSHRERLWF